MGELEELRRVNAELAAELRALAEGRAGDTRSGQTPAARGVAQLLAEKDDLAARLEDTEGALEATRADRDGLERQNQEMEAEILRLRSGFLGLLRRARARLLHR